jgi:hypothetical protein
LFFLLISRSYAMHTEISRRSVLGGILGGILGFFRGSKRAADAESLAPTTLDRCPFAWPHHRGQITTVTYNLEALRNWVPPLGSITTYVYEYENDIDPDWYGGTTIWDVRYDYADDKGGGEATDFFKTPNRYTPPTGLQITGALHQQGQVTVLGIERIKPVHTITPADDFEYTASDFGRSKHGVIFDAFSDVPPDYGLHLEDV